MHKGYTIIELLIVTFIIGLLVALIAVALQGNLAKARDAKRLADLTQIQKALALYYDTNGKYPPIELAKTGPENDGCGIDWCVLRDSLSVYLNPLPNDPLGLQEEYRYFYSSSSDDNYGLMVRFESDSNANKVINDGGVHNDAATLEYYEVGSQTIYE